MFDELAEYEWVIELLTESAAYQNHIDITDLTGDKSELVRRVNALIDAVTEKEKATIARPDGKYEKRNVIVGFSEESKLLCQLWSDLGNCNTPIKLRAALPEMRVALLKAMVIDRELKQEGLTFEYRKILPLAIKGRRFTESKRNTDALGSVIQSILEDLGSGASAEDVLGKLNELANNRHEVIQEIEDNLIYWKAKSGKEKKTSFRAFENRLSGYRKRI